MERVERPFPVELGTCADAPAHRPVVSLTDLIELWADERAAGSDCRDKLSRLRDYYTEEKVK